MRPKVTASAGEVHGRVIARSPFRLDIQGLRAVAVLLVVIYHTGVLGLTGGFVGVDVFFVISGFLITNHLLSQLQRDGRIDFGQFYARRVRRILPASFVVLLLTIVASSLLLPPVLRTTVLNDGIWTALYVPNISFAVQGTDYLAETAPSPFQHYWSLGVEEQFYLLWPLVLILVWLASRKTRTITFVVVAVLVAVSLVAAIVLTFRSQPWAFFSLPTRAWELGIGALVAIASPVTVARIAPALRSIGAWVGLAAVIASAVLLDATTAFPGYAAMIPVLGSAAVIYFGQHETPFGPRTLLSLRPMVFVGAISYSLYLVHWPLLVVPAAMGGTQEPLHPLASIAWALIGVPIAWVLYEFVENPVRRSAWLSSLKARWILVSALVGSVATVCIAVALITAMGMAPQHAGKEASDPAPHASISPEFTPYVPSNLKPTVAAVADDIPIIYDDGCHLAVPEVQVQDCAFGDIESETVVALFGDSHAAQWFPALNQLASEHAFRLESYTKSSCPSADVDIYVKGILYTECATWRSQVIEHLNSTQPDLVILSNMANQPGQPDGGIDPKAWAEGVRTVIDSLSGIPVTVISDTPHMGSTPSICLSANVNATENCARPRAEALDDRWTAEEAQGAVNAGATVVDLNDHICDSESCGPIIGATLLYRDAHHLTTTFVKQLAPELWKQLAPQLNMPEDAS